jgi:hypothetical protein
MKIAKSIKIVFNVLIFLTPYGRIKAMCFSNETPDIACSPAQFRSEQSRMNAFMGPISSRHEVEIQRTGFPFSIPFSCF